MNRVKNFVANIPIFIGLLFKAIGDVFFNLSFKLHITFNTDAGLKLVELDKAAKELAKTLKEQKQPAASGDRKLADIIGNTGQVYTTFSKKPTKLDN